MKEGLTFTGDEGAMSNLMPSINDQVEEINIKVAAVIPKTREDSSFGQN